MLSRHTLKALLAALAVTIAFAVVALLGALVVLIDTDARDGGIGASAGGISQKLVALVALTLPVVFVIAFRLLRRSFR